MSSVIKNPDILTPPRKKRIKRRRSKKSQPSSQTLCSYTPKTTLGRKLWDLRQQMIASGTPLLDWNELEYEISERKGEERRDINETNIH
jgi:hypothetical protein